MGTLRDIFDIYKEFRDNPPTSSSTAISKPSNAKGSIAEEARKGILQFPVLCTSLLSLEEATMISKALEREYVSFVTVLTTINSITDEKQVTDYLKQIHQNFQRVTPRDVLSDCLGVKRLIPIMNKNLIEAVDYLDKGMCRLLHESFDVDVDDSQDPDSDDMQLTILNDDDDDDLCDVFEIIDCFNMDDDMGIDDDATIDECTKLKENVFTLVKELKTQYPDAKFYSPKNAHGIIISEGEMIQEALVIKNKNDNSFYSFITPKFNIRNKKINLDSCKTAVKYLSEQSLKPYENDLRMDILNDKVKNQNYSVISTNRSFADQNSLYGKKLSEASPMTAADTKAKGNTNDAKFKNVYDNILTDNDVKKANELVPTMMHLKTYFKDDKGELQAVDYVIGVKTILHVIPSQSMVDNIVRGVKRSRTFFNFLKWTTGETEFWKDFVLTIPDIKSDIKSKYMDSPWWNALVRRRKMSTVLKGINSKKQLLPNTTLVLSMDEVHQIKSEYSIDLMQKENIYTLVSEYFLLGVVVVDASLETAYFYFDGQTDYAQFSYSSLEKENSNSTRTVKDIMQVLGKM